MVLLLAETQDRRIARVRDSDYLVVRVIVIAFGSDVSGTLVAVDKVVFSDQQGTKVCVRVSLCVGSRVN